MLKIGITGGIGSGKSTACSFFKELGIPVFSADDYGKEILHTNQAVRQALTKTFGEDIYNEVGELQRAKLADIVFNDKDKLAQLNAIVHPQVAIGFEEWVNNQRDVPYVLKEAAIMFESNSHKQLDQVIVVVAPAEERISRVMERDNVNREQVMERIQNQWTDEQRAEKADYILTNDTISTLKSQVHKLHQQLIS